MADNEFTAIEVALVLADDMPLGAVEEQAKRAERHNLSLSQLVFLEAMAGFPITVNMGCGTQHVFRNFDDIPEDSMPCPCGDPGHWLFRFTVSGMPEDPGDEIPPP